MKCVSRESPLLCDNVYGEGRAHTGLKFFKEREALKATRRTAETLMERAEVPSIRVVGSFGLKW